MEEKKLIKFNFNWEGKGFNEIAPNVMEAAKKLVELNLIRVEENLDDEGNVIIRHVGVCRTEGLVGCITSSLVEENIYSYRFRVKPYNTLANICAGKKESKTTSCELPTCPIMVAGYLYYLENRDVEGQEITSTSSDDNNYDVHTRNNNELRNMKFDQDIEEFLQPLTIPDIKGLRTAFIGEEGTDKEHVIDKIAEFLFRIGKLSSSKVIYKTISSLESSNLSNDYLYVIEDIDGYLEAVINNDDFGSEAEKDRKKAYKGLKKIINQSKGKYVIVNATPLEFKKFLNTNAKLPYIFDETIYFKDQDDEKLLQLFEENLPEYHKQLFNSENNKSLFLAYLERNRKYFPFKNSDLSLFLAGYVSRKKEFILPKERSDNFSLEESFQNIIGMNNIKNQIRELYSFLTMKNKLEKQGIKFPDFNLHMLFLGNPGTGKTTVARLISKILFKLGYIKENKCIEVEAKDLVAAYGSQSFIKTNRVINSAIGGVLFVDEAYSLIGYNSSISVLVKAMEENKGELVVIFAGYSKEMQEFIGQNSGIKSRIGYTLEFADYTEDELYKIYELKAKNTGFSIGEDAEFNIRQLINFGKTKKNFGNGRYIDNIFQKTLVKHSTKEIEDEKILTIHSDSIPTVEEVLTQSSGERNPKIIDELFKDIVGLDNIKKQVIELGKYIKFREKMAELSDTRLPDMRLHMLFTGDAGTGKTTMARKITEMLYNLGCIRINKLVEVDRKDLIGEYVGQSAPKTERVIEGALGGVLFIDEAYSLTPKDSSKDYGQEVIATLIKAMEDYRDDLVVIFAGYTEEMKRFVNSNSGIASRIGYTFEFENYKDEELYKIFEIKCKKYNLNINKDVKEKVMELFKYFSSVENYGNGRFVDKVLQEVLVKHAQNFTNKNLNNLCVNDIPSIKDMIDKTFNNRDNLVIPSDVDMESRKQIAIHEIGHALINYLYTGETNLKVITVIPEGTGYLGHVLHSIPKNKILWTKRDYLDDIEELLAGRAAEELLLGKDKVSSGCYNDLEKASSKLANMYNDFGMSNTLGLRSSRGEKPNLEMLQKLDFEKKEILDNCYQNVMRVLNENIHLFNDILDVLMEKGTLTGEEFVEIIKRNN